MDKLDKYEKDILESYKNDEWVPAKDLEDVKRRFAEYAKNTFKKNKRINIRISEKDLADIKVKSLEKAIEIARRPDEKKLALAALAATKSQAALSVVEKYLEDNDVKAEAKAAYEEIQKAIKE